ncbi:MAG: T9SS type A sorting domain-containing protein, partial [Bacteroidota bacterium]
TGVVFLFHALSTDFLSAATWEMGIPVSSGTRVRIWQTGQYTHDAIAGANGQQNACGYTVSFYLDIGDDNTGGVYGSPLCPGTTYTIVIGNRAVDLITPAADGDLGDFLIIYQGGHFSLQVCAGNPHALLRNERDWIAYAIAVKNSFDAGSVIVDGSTNPSGVQLIWERASSHTLGAIDRQYIQDPGNGQWYYRIYQKWMNTTTGMTLATAPQLSASITVTGDATYTANFAKEFNIWFENSFAGVGNRGIMKVNGTEYQLPLTQPFHVVGQQNPPQAVTAEALPQTINGIRYSFTQWEDGSMENPRTFTPTDHATYRAHYAGKPVAVTMKSLGGPVGEPVQIVWYNHVNPNVTQYQLWRMVKHNGVVGDPVLLAMLNRPDSSYTDYAYLNTGSYTDDLLYYDARAYYSVEGSYADPNYTATFGEPDLGPKVVGGAEEQYVTEVDRKGYSLSVSPNPISARGGSAYGGSSIAAIRFSLPEAGHVVLKVMDILGREVLTLVDEERGLGEHAVSFDASRLASGVYFCRLQAGSFLAVKKVVLVK